ncbi:hypothetical protein ICM_06205 [Bacillus cereus BAG1X2-3]|uniref:DNA-binding protein n=1 Tax=Bacillus cereus TaxID=1396 RepID=A0A9X7E1H7_BACCE|nr:hypothetical protein [Bacillus cereus]EOO22982.1 hypothetical protein ICC_06352 [Bacillus cereus BAG1X1-1]EOO42762.1 hypothetical protein ICI_06269 [Bacillus cereus BAG1X2-1]EOO43874.1 hypothetical protein ICK_06567 [Bacillus cereus BAG1X2-2]EOO55904.1 hypothetical protein ICM_06205 [Bacillus cereus BAG1X2-3]EOO99983.1 hypothetical protein ICO_06615 [Bacillus cereus BAG2O-1]
MVEKWLTISEIEKTTKIPYVTVKRYIRLHGHHLKIKKNENSYLISSDFIPLLLKLKLCYQEGKDTNQIEELLCYTRVIPEIKIDYREQSMVVNVTETLLHMNASLCDLNKKYDAIVNEFQKQKEYMDKKFTERDETLLQIIQEEDKVHKGVAKYKFDKNWWQFWKL